MNLIGWLLLGGAIGWLGGLWVITGAYNVTLTAWELMSNDAWAIAARKGAIRRDAASRPTGGATMATKTTAQTSDARS